MTDAQPSKTGKALAMLPLFVRDYLAATRHMSLAERGAYTDLLFFQWEMGPLPNDPDRLARLLGCSGTEFAKLWATVSAKFEQAADGLTNARLEQHRAEAFRLRNRKLLGAALTNAKRSAKRGAQRSHSVTLSGSPPSPSPSPSLKKAYEEGEV